MKQKTIYLTYMLLPALCIISGIHADGILNSAGFNRSAGQSYGGSVAGMWYMESAFFPSSEVCGAVALQKTKYLVVGGWYSSVYFNSHGAVIVRLNSDGTLDNSFGNSLVSHDLGYIQIAFEGADNNFYSVVVQPNANIVVGGGLVFGGITRFSVAKFLADGSDNDVTFNSSGSSPYGGPNPGYWMIIGSSSPFTTNSSCKSVALQSDGSILAAGYLGVGGVSKLALLRLTSAGVLDTSFAVNSTVPGIWYAGGTTDNQTYLQADTALLGNNAVCIQSDGKILVAARFKTVDGLSRAGVMRYNINGTLDTTFNATGSGTFGGSVPGFYVLSAASGDFSNGAAYSVVQDSSGNILVSGSINYGGVVCPFIMRLTSAGVLDTTFNTGGQLGGYGGTQSGFWILTAAGASIFTSGGYATQAALDTCNRIVVTATAGVSSGDSKILAFRLTSAGVLDTSFNPAPGQGNPYGGFVPGIWYFSTDNTGQFLSANNVSSGLVIPKNSQILLACMPSQKTLGNRLAIVSLTSNNGVLQDTLAPFNTGVAGLILTTTINKSNQLVVGGNYFNTASAICYRTSGTPRDSTSIFGTTNGATLFTNFAINSSINKLINYTLSNNDNGYIATGVSSSTHMTTMQLTSTGVLNSTFNTTGYVQETDLDISIGYGLWEDNNALSVSGFTNITIPTIVNYNASTGARNSHLGSNGVEAFSSYPSGVIYSITRAPGKPRTIAGQNSNTAFVGTIVNSKGVLQDTAVPFNTVLAGLILTTTIDQLGSVVVGGFYGNNATAVRYTNTGTRDLFFGDSGTGTNVLTSLTSSSSINRIINAANNGYLAAGASNNGTYMATISLTNTGTLNTSFNSSGYIEEKTVGVSAAYDMLLNGTALLVAGFTAGNIPSMINYNSLVGIRNSLIGNNGLQIFKFYVPGTFYSVNTTTSVLQYAAGQSNNNAFLGKLSDQTGLLLDTAVPFNTGVVGLILTTTIDQSGKIVAGGFYGNNATAVRYTNTGTRDLTFGGNSTGVNVLTSLTSSSSINKIINAANNGYLATGASNNSAYMATISFTNTGTLNTIFNSSGYVVETGLGASVGYDMSVNGTALSVAGVTNTNNPSVLNYNSLTGVRNSTVGVNGYQNYSSLGIGIMYAITSSGGKRYGAGQAKNAGFVNLLPSGGVLQDTGSSFNTSLAGLILTTTIDQSGSIVVGGFYGNNATAVRYTTSAGRDGTFGSNGVTVLTSLAPTSSINKIINSGTGYLATGVSNSTQVTTLSLTSAGGLNSAFNSSGYVVETGLGASAGYDMSVNGTALSVAGVTNTNNPSVLNYNSLTGVRNSTVGVNGYQNYSSLGIGIMYAITSSGGKRYGAGQAKNTGFVNLLPSGGVLQDTGSSFNTSLAGLILTTTIDQSGSIVVGGFYGNNAIAVRYTKSAGRDGTFGSNGVTVLTSLAPTSSINKIINASGNGYLATGVSNNNQVTTLSLTSAGGLNSAFNSTGYVVETGVGASSGYDLLLNGTALSVAGFVQTSTPSVINYNSGTGARNTIIGNNGVQTFNKNAPGVFYSIKTTTGALRYAAGQSNYVAFVGGLQNQTGLLQDIASPFNAVTSGLILTTTIDKLGNVVVGGYYGSNATAVRYTYTGTRDLAFGTGSSGANILVSLSGPSSLNKIINASSNGYLATGYNNGGVFITVSLTSSGIYNTTFGSPIGFVSEGTLGLGVGYDMLLNGTALSVVGVTNFNSPSVLNYNSLTGIRNSTLGANGYQRYSSFGTGVMYGIATTTGGNRYTAGQVTNGGFVKLLPSGGILQDTGSPFNATAGLILTTTIDQLGKIVVGGQFNSTGQVTRYTITGARDATFGLINGSFVATPMAVVNKVINAATNGYLVAGANTTNQFTTALFTNAGVFNTVYGFPNGYVQEVGVGTSAAYDLLLNGTALSVAGFTQTNMPSVINYNSGTGARNNSIGSSGLQIFKNYALGTLYGIKTTTGTLRYAAGQSNNSAFVGGLWNQIGLLQDTTSPFNTSLVGLILTTTIDQSGSIVVGGFYGNNATAVRYTTTAGRDGTFGNNGVTSLTSLSTTSSINKIINASNNGYLAVGTSGSGTKMVTVSLTSTGTLNTTFNGSGFVQETGVGVSAAMGLLLNGTALAVAGFTGGNVPSIINYNSVTGSRSGVIGDRGLQQFSLFIPGIFNSIAVGNGKKYYGIGQVGNFPIVTFLFNGSGLYQDTGSSLNAGSAGLILTTTIDQLGEIVVGGFYGNNATAMRYTNTAGRDGNFGNNGVTVLTSLTSSSSLNKIINASSNGYLAVGASNSGKQMATVSLTSTGTLNTTFNGSGFVQEITVGNSVAYSMLLNGTALSVAGFVWTSTPAVINYNSSTGVRNTIIGNNGIQTFKNYAQGILYDIATTIGILRYAAGQSNGKVLLGGLQDQTGLLRDITSPFNTGANGFIYTTTIDQNGKIVVGGQYNTGAMTTRYTTTAGRDGTFGNNGIAALTALATTATIQKIINSGTGYLATGVSNTTQVTTLLLTSTGGLNSTFNSKGYVVETSVGASSGYDLLLNGTALSVAGFVQTSTPSVINYNSGTGARNTIIGNRGVQTFKNYASGILYNIKTTTGALRYAAGQSNSIAFVGGLQDQTGLLKDTFSPFDTGFAGLILTTTIDQSGKIVVGGFYGNNATAVRYTTSAGRDGTFGNNGVTVLTSLAPTSSINKIINAANNGYLATGASATGGQIATVSLTSSGTLNTTFNGTGYVQETSIPGPSAGYDLLLNGTALAVAGVTQTNSPSVINYNSSTGARNASFKSNGYQQFPEFGTGSINAIAAEGVIRYGAGIGTNNNTAFVKLLVNGTGLLQDTASPFNASTNGFIYTTTIDQSGNVIVGGQYNAGAMTTRYTYTGTRDQTFGPGTGVANLTALATTATIQKIINSGTGYLATGVSNSTQVTTLSLTSAGGLNSAFNSSGYVVETGVGASSGYDLLLNGTALSVAGFVQTSTPSVINYNSATGARNTIIGNNGVQTFKNYAPGILYSINTTTGILRYASGQSNNIAFVGGLQDQTGLLKDTASPFNTGANGFIYTTTIDQSGKFVVGGQYNAGAMTTRYTTTAGRDGTFGNNGVANLTALATTSTIQRIINSGTGYLATGVSNSTQVTTLSLTSTGGLNSAFNSGGYVVETGVGASSGYDLLLNGTALSVAGFVQTSTPSVINYNSGTGARNTIIGNNGVQTFKQYTPGILYNIKTTTGALRYAAGQSNSIAFVGGLQDQTGLLQDTASPFNASTNGFIYTTTIDQSGKFVVGGQYNAGAMTTRYTTTAGRDGTFGNNGVANLTALATTATIQKIINSGTGYLATGVSNSTQVTTLLLTSAGGLNSAFNSTGYVVETGVGASSGYDLLLNGTALSVAGFVQTSTPSVINYNSTTGVRNTIIGNNGVQTFKQYTPGILYSINTTTDILRYAAGQSKGVASVLGLQDPTGLLQDTLSPFNTSLVGLILTTTIDQLGSIVVGGFYGNNATAIRYTTSAGRDGTFGDNGVTLLTSLAPTSSINKIINAVDNGYLATGASATGGQIATVSLTSSGILNTIFNGTGYVEETGVGVSTGYDMLLNGIELAVAGVTQTNMPSVINYNSSTGARDTSFKSNGYQQFPELGIGSINAITTEGISRYGAGIGTNYDTAFVKLLVNGTGILQDTAAPFDTGANGLLYTTTLDQSGNIVVGGQYSNLWEVVSYLPTAARNTAFGGSGNGVAAAPFGVGGRVRSLALDSTGRIIATGASQDGSNEVFTTVRYNNTGSASSYVQESLFGVGSGLGLDVYADNSFSVPGFTTTGTSATPTIINYNADLTRNTYNQYTNLVPGYFYRIVDIDGSHYAAGSAVDTAIVYSLINGTGLLLDTAAPFNTGHNGTMYGGMIDGSGNIVLCGNYNDIFTVVSYLNTGTRNTAFNNNGVVQDSTLNVANGYAITQDSAGSYYVAASSTAGGNLTFTVVKYTNAGVLDATFGNGGVIQEINLGIGKATAITINNGTVFVGGQTTVNGTLLPTLIAYTTNGQRLAPFGTNGVQTYPNFGEGILNNLTVINISTIASAGQMGDVATIVQLGQSNNLVDQINNGF